MKPFTLVEADALHELVMTVRSLTCEEVDVPAVTPWVCLQYGFNTCDINEARYKAFIRMSRDNEKEPLARTKINCASLPPCTKTPANHTKRAHFGARIWTRSDQTDPTGEASPTDYGWKRTESGLGTDRYPKSALPECLTATPTNDGTAWERGRQTTRCPTMHGVRTVTTLTRKMCNSFI